MNILGPEEKQKAVNILDKVIGANRREKEELKKEIYGRLGDIKKKKKKAPRRRKKSLQEAERLLRNALKKM